MTAALRFHLAFITFSISVNAFDYLTEKPAFLIPCPIHTNVNPQCFSKSIQNLFANWRDGVEVFKGVGQIDPFKIKRLRLSQHAEGVADIQLELKNAIITGMRDTKVVNSSIDAKDYTFFMKLNVPMSKLTSDYKLKGRILLLNIDGNGRLEMNLKNIDFNVIAITNLVKRGDEYFFDIKSVTTEVTKVGNFRIHFTNLFNGNKEFEDSAHELFNNSWQTLFEALRPGITRTFDSIIGDRYKKVFHYIPARYFISDLF